MRMLAITVLALGTCLYSVQTLADDNCGDGYTTSNFMRSDLVTIKKHVETIISALGTPPAPYAKENENWQLPTYACQGKVGFQPVIVRYSMSLTTDAQQKIVAADYQKKLMAAEASGNMQEVMQLAQQAQQKALQQAAVNQNNEPINVDVSVNDLGASMTIDPDAVLRDGAGFIALRQPNNDASSGKEEVDMFFDKVILKNAHEIASFGEPNAVVPTRLDMICARININGPKAQVENMVKHLSAGAVLGQLGEKRTNIN